MKWQDTVRQFKPIPVAQRLVIAHIGATANPDGRNAWRANDKLVEQLGVSPETVKRARTAGVRYGLMVVTKSAPRSRGNRKTHEYRLVMPANRNDSISGVSSDLTNGDTTNDLVGSADSVSGVTDDPLVGSAECTPSVIASGITSGGRDPRAEEPELLDAEVVPDPANGPSPHNQRAKQTDTADAWVDAELVDDEPDPEPQLHCDRHMPDGTDSSCGACGRRRRIREKWEQRQQTWLLRGIFPNPAEPAEPVPTVRRPAPPKPEPPSWVPGPDGRPRCRRHGHLQTAPVDCTRCHDAAIAAEEST